MHIDEITEQQPNMGAVRELYSIDKTARALFDNLAKRVYNSREQSVDQLERCLEKDGVDVSRRDITHLLKELQRAGCGEYIVGRKGHPSRFRWYVETVDVGRRAAGIPSDIGHGSLNGDEDTLAETRADGDSPASSDEFMHRFQLRPDLLVSLRLPADLTTPEAARLADFIKTLPFEGR
jgi:hypothetical protein